MNKIDEPTIKIDNLRKELKKHTLNIKDNVNKNNNKFKSLRDSSKKLIKQTIKIYNQNFTIINKTNYIDILNECLELSYFIFINTLYNNKLNELNKTTKNNLINTFNFLLYCLERLSKRSEYYLDLINKIDIFIIENNRYIDNNNIIKYNIILFKKNITYNYHLLNTNSDIIKNLNTKVYEFINKTQFKYYIDIFNKKNNIENILNNIFNRFTEYLIEYNFNIIKISKFLIDKLEDSEDIELIKYKILYILIKITTGDYMNITRSIKKLIDNIYCNIFISNYNVNINIIIFLYELLFYIERLGLNSTLYLEKYLLSNITYKLLYNTKFSNKLLYTDIKLLYTNKLYTDIKLLDCMFKNIIEYKNNSKININNIFYNLKIFRFYLINLYISNDKNIIDNLIVIKNISIFSKIKLNIFKNTHEFNKTNILHYNNKLLNKYKNYTFIEINKSEFFNSKYNEVIELKIINNNKKYLISIEYSKLYCYIFNKNIYYKNNDKYISNNDKYISNNELVKLDRKIAKIYNNVKLIDKYNILDPELFNRNIILIIEPSLLYIDFESILLNLLNNSELYTDNVKYNESFKDLSYIYRFYRVINVERILLNLKYVDSSIKCINYSENRDVLCILDSSDNIKNSIENMHEFLEKYNVKCIYSDNLSILNDDIKEGENKINLHNYLEINNIRTLIYMGHSNGDKYTNLSRIFKEINTTQKYKHLNNLKNLFLFGCSSVKLNCYGDAFQCNGILLDYMNEVDVIVGCLYNVVDEELNSMSRKMLKNYLENRKYINTDIDKHEININDKLYTSEAELICDSVRIGKSHCKYKNYSGYSIVMYGLPNI